jgi:hypothetical protein
MPAREAPVDDLHPADLDDAMTLAYLEAGGFGVEHYHPVSHA